MESQELFYTANKIAPISITEAPNKRSFILFSLRNTPPRIIIKRVDSLKIDTA